MFLLKKSQVFTNNIQSVTNEYRIQKVISNQNNPIYYNPIVDGLKVIIVFMCFLKIAYCTRLKINSKIIIINLLAICCNCEPEECTCPLVLFLVTLLFSVKTEQL